MSKELQEPDWIEPRPYQQEAVNSWVQNNGQGVFNMATGTGKTVTSLLTATELSKRLENILAVVIAVPYQHLVDQWADDINDFGIEPVLAYESRRTWQEVLERQIVEFNMGARDAFVVVTTHATFAMDPFQTALSRLNRAKVMLIADEVHHMGAPHLRKSLPERIQLRLGLSATPKRWYDDEGTEILFDYFGDIVYEYPLKEAIANGALCEYYYVPHIVELSEEETEDFFNISQTIGRLAARSGDDLGDADLQDNPALKQALFKRARLVGSAQNKLVVLHQLLEQEDDVSHTLVYCGDGKVDSETTGETNRQVDAAVQMLRNEMGLNAHRFTARESQSQRRELLKDFESGELQVLVAIRCLDEGVDVPATRTAYMLASSSNPRQFVQRRGRILRTFEGKDYAVIHDFITTPQIEQNPEFLENDEFNPERRLVKKELERVGTFTDAARNHPDATIQGIPRSSGSLQDLKRRYNLLQM